jgi:hypothetical protein
MYRFNHDEWNYDQAYEEMKNYDFYTRFGHGALKKYVEDYWRRLQTKGPQPSSAPLSSRLLKNCRRVAQIASNQLVV